MATITRNNLKSGEVSYRIRVKIKDIGTGKQIAKTTTWKKPEKMPIREAEKAASKYAMEYEEKIKRYQLGSNLNENTTVKKYSEIWAEYIHQHKSSSYYQSILHHLKTINESLGSYQIKELSPVIIQNFFDTLSARKRKIELAISTKLPKLIDEKKTNKTQLARLSGVSRSTIALAASGNQISMECAQRITKALCVPFKDYFKPIVLTSNYQPATNAKTCRTLRAMLSMAKRQQLLEQNFANSEYVTLIKEERKEVVCLDDVQAKELLTDLKNHDDIRVKTALMLLIFTGFRRGELCGLEWDDIDFEDSLISIKRASCPVTSQGVITCKPKSKTSARTITVPNIIINLLKEYHDWWKSFTTSLGDRYKGSKRLFLQSDGKPIYPTTLRYWLNTITKRLELPNITIHSLRHTNITMQIIAGIPLKTVSVRAGHSSTKLTSDTYSHFIRSSDKEAADTLNRMLS